MTSVTALSLNIHERATSHFEHNLCSGSSGHPIHFMFDSRAQGFGVGGSNGTTSGWIKSNMAAGGHLENFKCPYLCSWTQPENNERGRGIQPRLATIQNIFILLLLFIIIIIIIIIIRCSARTVNCVISWTVEAVAAAGCRTSTLPDVLPSRTSTWYSHVTALFTMTSSTTYPATPNSWSVKLCFLKSRPHQTKCRR